MLHYFKIFKIFIFNSILTFEAKDRNCDTFQRIDDFALNG
jgi:hypothetical protein